MTGTLDGFPKSGLVECTRRGGRAVISRESCLKSYLRAIADDVEVAANATGGRNITTLIECRDCPVGAQLKQEQNEMKKKTKPEEKGSSVKLASGMVECPECGKLCKPAGLGRHQAKHRNADPAAAKPNRKLRAEGKNPGLDTDERRSLRSRVVSVAVRPDARIADLIAVWPGLGEIITAYVEANL